MLSVVDIKVKKAADGILKFAETLAATLEGSKNDVNSTSHFPPISYQGSEVHGFVQNIVSTFRRWF